MMGAYKCYLTSHDALIGRGPRTEIMKSETGYEVIMKQKSQQIPVSPPDNSGVGSDQNLRQKLYQFPDSLPDSLGVSL